MKKRLCKKTKKEQIKMLIVAGILALFLITLIGNNFIGKSLTGFVVSEETITAQYNSSNSNLEIREPTSVFGNVIAENKNKRMDFDIQNSKIRLYFDLLNYSSFVESVANEIINESYSAEVDNTSINETNETILDASYSITGNAVEDNQTVEINDSENPITENNESNDKENNESNQGQISNITNDYAEVVENPASLININEIKDKINELANENSEKLQEITDNSAISAENFDIEVNKTSETDNYKWGYKLKLNDLKFMAKIEVTSELTISEYNRNTLRIGRSLLSFDDLEKAGYKVRIEQPSLVIPISNITISNATLNATETLLENMTEINVTDLNISEINVSEVNVSEIDITEINETDFENINENNITIINETYVDNVTETNITIINVTEITINETISEINETIVTPQENIDEVIVNNTLTEEKPNQEKKEEKEAKQEEKEDNNEGNDEKEKETKQEEKEDTNEGEKEEAISPNIETPVEPGIIGNVIRFFYGFGSLVGSVIEDITPDINSSIEDVKYANTIIVYIERDFNDISNVIDDEGGEQIRGANSGENNDLEAGKDYEDIDKDGEISLGDIIYLDPTLIIIPITGAEHLDSNRIFISDIYEQTKALDNNWSEVIPSGDFVRAYFSQNLTKDNDITIYAKASNYDCENVINETSNETIERCSGEKADISVSRQDSDEEIARFENITSEGYYKVYLTNLSADESLDTFDLRSNGDVEYDYIVDPSQYNLTDGQVLWMHFDNDSSVGENATNVYDWSGNGNNGTVTGAVWNSQGKYGGGYNFSFSGKYIKTGSNPISGTQAFTIVAWIKPYSYGSYMGAISLGSSGCGNSAYIGAVPGSLGGGIYCTDSSFSYTPTGQWTHVAMTFAGGDNGALIYYVNGNQNASTVVTPHIAGGDIRIGRLTTDTNADFDGLVDEVRIWNRSLSAYEIKALYNIGAAGGVAVTDCSTLYQANQYYFLNQSIANNSVAGNGCIIVSAANITFDCNGYSITSATNTSGVYSNQYNTTVKNCNISMGSDGNSEAIGIEMTDDADYSSIINNTIIGEMRYGINFGPGNNGPEYSLIENNTVNVSAVDSTVGAIDTTGIYLKAANNNTLRNNNATTLGEYGIHLISAHNNNLTSNTGTSNSSYGIYIQISNNNNLTSNTGTSNSNYGIILSNSKNNTLTGNAGTSNSDNGIGIVTSSANNTLINNIGTSNSGAGIYLYNDANNNYLINNTGISNTGNGLNLGGTSINNNLVNNTGTTNATTSQIGGIVISGSGYNNLTSNIGISYRSRYGIFLTLSDNLILDSNIGISNTSYVLYLSSSNNNSISNQTAIGNFSGSYGIVFNNANNTVIRDCINITGISGDVLYVTNPSINSTFINCSYRITGNNETVIASSTLFRKWYYQAYVNDSSGTAVSGVNVSAYNSSGSLEFSGLMTNASGWTNITSITEYVNNGTRTYYSNYFINATYGGSMASKSFNVSNISGNGGANNL